MHCTCISEQNTDLFAMTETELQAVIIEQNLKDPINDDSGRYKALSDILYF